MFNNLFDSFQDTVAEAKEEREQLNRLLTISTPRERLLVAAVALLLIVLAAWLFFGSVPRTVAVDGVLVQSGESRIEGKQSAHALVWIEADAAAPVEAGMPAALELGGADGETGTLGGRVAGISAVSLPEELNAVGAAAPVSVRRLVIALDGNRDPASLAGRKARIVIELGRQSPITLFRMRRP